MIRLNKKPCIKKTVNIKLIVNLLLKTIHVDVVIRQGNTACVWYIVLGTCWDANMCLMQLMC